jgi:hypothetical protein
MVRRHLDGLDHPPSASRDVEPEFGEQPPEQAVEFEAEPTAFLLDDLFIEYRKRQRDATTVAVAERVPGDGKRLEGDCLDVCPLETVERCPVETDVS